MSAAALWARLASAGLVTGEMPVEESSPTPWYVRVMLCVAGIIAAAFLMAFVGAGLMFIVVNASASAVCGIALIAAALAIFHVAPRSDFLATFALSISVLGQAFLVWVLGTKVAAGPGSVAVAILVLEIALALAMPNFIHRVLSALAAGFALIAALAPHGLAYVAPGLLVCAAAWLWLNECRLAARQSVVVPIAYGLTLAYVQIEAVPTFGIGTILPGHGGPGVSWPAEALAGAALVTSIVVLLRRAGWQPGERRTLLAVASALAIAAASFQAPGLAGCLAVAVLGFANGNRVLLGLGVLAMVFYASTYYYLLELTLLQKSGVLIGTGVVLLAARWILLRRVMPEEVTRA